MRVLLLEDDQRLSKLMERVFKDEAIALDVSGDGRTGLDLLLRGTYDVAVVDWMLPGRDGPAICRAAREAGVKTGLMMLTARSQIEDRVAGLNSGADDYLVKPFAIEELLARVRALARRATTVAGDPWELRCRDLVMDMTSHSARRGGQPLDLTSTEWNLLECFLRHPGQALSRQQILDYVWSYEREVQPTMVDVYVSYLRRKLNVPGRRDPIQTVRGLGYRLESEHV